MNKKPIVIRLADIDCPERSQPFGRAAKKFCSEFCFGKEVRILSNGKFDRYDRLIGTVEFNGQSLNKELVRNGLAWHFKRYSKDKEFAALEVFSREQSRGLWSQSNPIPPWEWRRQ